MDALRRGKVVAAITSGKLKTALLMLGLGFLFFYNLPFELINLKVADVLIYFALIMSIVSGIEYYKMIIAMALGKSPLELWEQRRDKTKAGLAKMILETEKSGIIDNIKYTGRIEGNVVEVTFFKHQGDKIKVFENSNDCVGQIVIQGDTICDCTNTLQNVMKQIKMEIK